MDFDDLTCTICMSPFDNGSKEPHMIPSCGHTFCAECIQKIIDDLAEDEDFSCPDDQITFFMEKKELSQFPKNLALLKLVGRKSFTTSPKSSIYDRNNKTNSSAEQSIFEEQLLQQKISLQSTLDSKGFAAARNSLGRLSISDGNFCKEHMKKLEIICMDDHERICASCALFGNHKNHNVRPEEDVMKDIAKVAESIIDIFEMVTNQEDSFITEDQIKGIEERIYEKKKQIEEMADQGFEHLIKIINQQKDNIHRVIEQKFNKLTEKVQETKKLPEKIAKDLNEWKLLARDKIILIDEKTNNNEIPFEILNLQNPSKTEQSLINRGKKIHEKLSLLQKMPESFFDEFLEHIRIDFSNQLISSLENGINLINPVIDQPIYREEDPKKSPSRKSHANQLLHEEPSLDKQFSFGTRKDFVDRNPSARQTMGSQRGSAVNGNQQYQERNSLAVGANNITNSNLRNSTLSRAEMMNNLIRQSLDKRMNEDFSLLKEDFDMGVLASISRDSSLKQNEQNSEDFNSTKGSEQSSTIVQNKENQAQAEKQNGNLKSPRTQKPSLYKPQKSPRENGVTRTPTKSKTPRATEKKNFFQKEESKLNTSAHDDSMSNISFQNESSMSLTPNSKKSASHKTLSTKKKMAFKITDKFAQILESIENQAIEVVDLTGLEIGDSGAQVLAEALSGNNSVKNCKLLKNKLTDEGGIALANALSSNTKLHTINFTQNHLSEKTIDAFLELFRFHKVIHTIYFNQNNISLRSVKAKIKEINQLGINISV